MRRCLAVVEGLAAWARCGLFAAAATVAGGGVAAAEAIDCNLGGCVADVARMPASPNADMADILKRAQRFFGTNTQAYIVNSNVKRATLPYLLRRQGVIVERSQIHIPEVYYARIELQHRGKRHFVWNYIIGHEMAHAYQEQTGLLKEMFVEDSVLLAELHADYLAGFFMAREFELDATAVDSLLRELQDLPAGEPGSADYHGEPGWRFFIATQGALAAFKRPTPSLAQASAAGAGCVLDLLFVNKGAKTLSEICR